MKKIDFTKKYSIQMSFIGFMLLCSAVFAFEQTTHAMIVRGGETYTLDPYATIEDDLYVLGKTVTISGTTTGDVFTLGSYVEYKGTSTSDILMLGGNVSLDGTVAGDVRVASGKVTISGHITEDVVVFGGTVLLGKDATIDGDLFVIGDYVVLEGTINGQAQIKARLIEVQGRVEKDFKVTAREAVSFTKDAVVEGNLTYSAPREAFISDTTDVRGMVTFTQSNAVTNEKNINVIGLVFVIVLTIVAGVVFVVFFSAQARTMVDISLREGSGMRMCKAALLLIAWPLVSLLLIITFVGVIPGIISLLFFGVSVFVAIAFTPVLAGVFLARWAKREQNEIKPLWTSLGAIGITLVAYMPILGWIVRFLFFLLAFHATFFMFIENVWIKRKVSQDTLTKEKERKGEENAETKEK